jgi:2-methylcitrate dehydratase PrpD
MLLGRLADYALAERTSRLSPEVVHHAKRALVDWYAALIAGSTHPPTRVLMSALTDEIDHGNATLGCGRRATVRCAALINGTASHAAEVDDVFREAVYHPGAPTISAALALAEANRVNGETVLRGIIVGYEIGTRIGATILGAHYKFWHTTGTVGCIGAAAAAATVLGTDRMQFVHALATATTFASGLQQAFRSDSMTKPLHAGHAAEIGVTSALAARHGLTGATDILEGKAGFGAAMAGNPEWENVLKGLGTRYNITQMTIKNHCCCGQAFATIDAVLALRTQHKFGVSDIESIEIRTYQTALDVAGTYQANTPAEARFSIPYVIARALVHGSVRLNAFEEEALADVRVRGLMARVRMVPEPRFDALFPMQRCASARIVLVDGQVLHHDQTTRKGDPDSPLNDQELSDKYFELTEPVIGRAAAETVLNALWSIDRLDTVDFLRQR